MIASMIVDECNRLYEGEPGDDTTVAAVRIRERTPVNLLMGPPADPRDATKMMTLFFSKEGKKIVCGGTTSQIAADYLHETIVTSLDYGTDPAIPPVGHMKGVDLVTEGVITMSRVVEYAKAFVEGTERADGRSLANRPAFVRVCHGHQFFYRQGHQSGAPEPGSAHYLRHQNTPGTGAFRISGKDGQTNQSELLLSRKPRRKAGFSQFRRFLIY